jgi:hypothetical protein
MRLTNNARPALRASLTLSRARSLVGIKCVQNPQRMPDITVRGAIDGDIVFEGSCTTATELWEKLKDVGEDIYAVQLLHGLREVLDTDFLLTQPLEFQLVRNASIAVLPRFLQRCCVAEASRSTR